jgi:hypothetical protein
MHRLRAQARKVSMSEANTTTAAPQAKDAPSDNSEAAAAGSEAQANASACPAAPSKLGEDRGRQPFTRAEQACAHALALIQQARRTLLIYSPDLEPWLYHHSSLQEAFTGFLLRSAQSCLRILVNDSRRAVREGHRLIVLAQRLPSHAEIRQCHPSAPLPKGTFLLADNSGLLVRNRPESITGYADYHDPSQVRRLQQSFQQLWDTSRVDPNLRRFLL